MQECMCSPIPDVTGHGRADMPEQVPETVKKQRAAQMQQVAETLHQQFCRQYIGQTVSVLAERGKEGIFEGHAENDMLVMIKSERALQGEIVQVRVTGMQEGIFVGRTAYMTGTNW